ncbi:neutral ceramidase-like, partial [Amphibalanus amphitrite]|uniref:neutral ceramidase-like n=1 Tax=Amphibalanus amphitrite TaxID=1232801 RepID=UPI001C907380
VARQLSAEFGGLYNTNNILLSATHTHSGPAGFLEYVLFQISNLGWVQESFDAHVAGIVQSIRRAHADLSVGYMSWSSGELLDANINRSPTAYLRNPQQERDRYQYDTDKEMVMLKFFNEDTSPKGMVNWFAVHGTSMNNTNQYISGDNKGYAEQMFESLLNGGSLPGSGPFVAAFASTNLGDVSPNTRGPKCIDTGLDCDVDTSTCDGRVETCIASGPGRDMVESTQIIGHKQFAKAQSLFFEDAGRPVSGPVDFIHQYIDMSNQTVVIQQPDGSWAEVKTCKAAMGFSFAAGTTDGPGAFDFTQSDTTGNEFWDTIRDMIKKPSPELEACHKPKPILLATGEIEYPYAWQPQIVPVQLLRLGDVIIIGMPGELTTMAGRRIREAVTARYAEAGETVKVVISGLSNTYSDYITTYEEYQKQRYEGASTVYGPHTHQAYLQKFQELATAMIQGTPVVDEAQPPNLLDVQMSFVPGVLFDAAPLGHHFGDVTQQPTAGAFYPGETVVVKFVSGHPRNNPMTDRSFLEVLKLQEDGSWAVVATDASWETFFKWSRTDVLLGHSEVTITWNIPVDAAAGTYKIRHMGYHKPAVGMFRRAVYYMRSLFTGLFGRMLGRAGAPPQSTFYYEGETDTFQIAQPWLTLRSFGK